MMIRTAGGPGTVSPIDFHERKTPRFSRTTWTALAVVIAAHLGVGVALYYQRFEMPLPVKETPTTVIELIQLPKPEPKPVVEQPPAQAPNTAVNTLDAPPTTTDVVHIVDGDKPAESPVTTKAPPEAPPTATSTAPTPPATPPVISNPSWISQPSADQLMRAYPDRALDRGVGGVVTLNCLVQPSGRVADCRTTGEPAGSYGFGRAAHSLTRHFQIAPRTVNGAAEGSRVNIAIRFNPPVD
jgi:protein TonB